MNPALTGAYLASLHSEIDMLIEPRMALDHLRSRLGEYEAFRFFGGREIRDFGADSVTDATGRVHRGDLVVLCPGMRSDLSATALSQPPVVRAMRLQVAQTEPLPAKLSAPVSDVSALISHALCGSLARPAGPVVSSLGDVELRLTAVQRPGGALTVGEARSYEEPFDFDVAERPATALLDKLATMLGTSAPTVARHWTGIVRECIDGRLWFRDNLDETVALVTGANQRGITMAPAIATDTFDWLLQGIDSGATRPGAMSR